MKLPKKIGYWYNKAIITWIVGVKGTKMPPIFAPTEEWAIKRAKELKRRFPDAKIVKLNPVEHSWDAPIWD